MADPPATGDRSPRRRHHLATAERSHDTALGGDVPTLVPTCRAIRRAAPAGAAQPISSYALLSDCQGSALVSRTGVGRLGAPPPIRRALDVRPTARSRCRPLRDRRWPARDAPPLPAGDDGAGVDVRVRHRILPGRRRARHRAVGGARSRRMPSMAIRVIEGVENSSTVAVVVPRPEYGMTVPRFDPRPGGLLTVGGPEQLVLSSPAPFTLANGGARALVEVRPGERIAMALRSCSPWEDVPTWEADEVEDLLDGTVRAWERWSHAHEGYDGAYTHLVRHSGRVLQALTYAPTGAVVAAPTTSLPETPGGSRNWDYRYCWVRDASLTMNALWIAACPDEADRFFDFLAAAAGTSRDGGPRRTALQILYGVGGERRLPEDELTHLAGYGGARPVRVGNGAWDQDQLDVYGELLDAADTLADQVGDFFRPTAALLVEAADEAARRWREPDNGIWEIRGEPRHFLYSKVMCWAALERAGRLAPRIGAEDRVAEWQSIATEIRDTVLERGWNEELGAYVQSFDSDALDASVLMLPIIGFVDAGEPRMRATIEAVERELTDELGLVHRYRSDDGLDGEEGSFLICSLWLAHCHALAGDPERARAVFDRVVSHANDVDLLAEEVDPTSGELLGNFPQAFTHIGLVSAAWAITRAERGEL
ncbi:MAG: glycoside hydrolase family 15 protein [Acidimicrobiia bacterium]|nr:glycoside hydrolase family 15 protein [Acidimicrobiia bacterium]